MKKWMSLLAVAAFAYSPVSADVIVDDFDNQLDDTDNQSALGSMFNYYVSADDKMYDAGYWYVYDDADDGGSSVASPDYMNDKEFEAGLGDGADGQGMVLAIQLGDATDEYETAFYGVGCNLTVDGNYSDLSKLKSVRFDAKGSGTMNLKFLTEVTDGYAWGDMAAAFKLSSSWETVSISVDDIAPEPWSPTAEDKITWDDVKSAVTKIHFQTNGDKMKAGDAVDFSIDNIYLVGMDNEDFEWDIYTIQEPYPTTAIAETKAVVETASQKVYPTAFNPTTTIDFSLPKEAKASLKIYDAAGNLVNTLFNGVTSGASVNWNATNANGAKVASGVYFSRLTSGSTVITKKMIFLK